MPSYPSPCPVSLSLLTAGRPRLPRMKNILKLNSKGADTFHCVFNLLASGSPDVLLLDPYPQPPRLPYPPTPSSSETRRTSSWRSIFFLVECGSVLGGCWAGQSERPFLNHMGPQAILASFLNTCYFEHQEIQKNPDDLPLSCSPFLPPPPISLSPAGLTSGT